MRIEPYIIMHIFHYFIFHNCNTCLYIADQSNHTEASHYTYMYISYIDNHFFYLIYVCVIFPTFLFLYILPFLSLLVRSTREQRKLLTPIRKVFSYPNLILRIGKWPKRTEKNKCREWKKIGLKRRKFSTPCVWWIEMGIEKEQERNQRWEETNKKERNIYNV